MTNSFSTKKAKTNTRRSSHENNDEAASNHTGTKQTAPKKPRASTKKQTPRTNRHPHARRTARKARRGKRKGPIYAAVDLGTNNCRLLMVRPRRATLDVVDSFSRIVRLGEGLTQTGRLTDLSIERTVGALKQCAKKIKRHQTSQCRLIATQACRQAENSDQFLSIVKDETGLELEIISQEIEAQLATVGCAALLDKTADYALIFDVGGGSSEFIWLDLKSWRQSGLHGFAQLNDAKNHIVHWVSLPIGVVSLSETHNLKTDHIGAFDRMVDDTQTMLAKLKVTPKIAQALEEGRVHYLGTSGTVTTLAGQFLKLKRYDRSKVDSIWLKAQDVRSMTDDLLAMSHEQRGQQPCIGASRADLVVGGCAILEGMFRQWPAEPIRVADRGLREGMLVNLIAQDRAKG